MPKWIHDRADHLRKKNPGMPKSQAFAIATQQSHAAGKSPKGYGTPEGRREAKQKYDRPAGAYEQKADPRSKAKTAGVLALLSGFTTEHEVHTKEIAMHPKLAGRLPLQAMVAQHIEAAREKLAAADEKDEKKVKKLVEYEKKEHGGKIPSVKEEEAEHEKKASIDFQDPEDIEKLASALEDVGEKVASDSIFNGGEARQGGEQLPTMNRVPGKQPYNRDAAKHQVPNGTGMMATVDNPGAATAIPTDDKRAPGGNGAKYPAKGVLKTAGQSVLERIEARKAEMFGEVDEGTDDAEKTAMTAGMGGALMDGARAAGVGAKAGLTGAQRVARVMDKATSGFTKVHASKTLSPGAKERLGTARIRVKNKAHEMLQDHGEDLAARFKKKASDQTETAVSYVLDKIAEYHGGGETLDDKPAPVPSNAGRELIQSAQSVTDATKKKAKQPRKAELAQVLTEPALTRSTDSKVHENLRNADKGGVKIAAAKALLQKIASGGCGCGGAGECQYCRLTKAIEAKKASQ